MKGPGNSTTSGQVRSGELSFYALAAVAWRYRWVLLFGPVLFGLMALGFIARNPSYKAESSFVPDLSGGASSQLAGVAAQFGFNVGALAGQGESVDFYARLVQSRELLTQLILTPYRFATEPGGADSLRGTLLELYRPAGDTQEQRILTLVERFRRRLTVSTDLRARVVTIETKAPWPELAVLLNRHLLDLVNEFNLRKRQTQATAERQFVEGRAGQALQDLQQVESQLERFLVENRSVQSSPRLVFEQSRLQRQVDLRQQVYVTLSQGLEQARIGEVRNKPVVTIIEAPEGSVGRSHSVLFYAAAGVAFGGFLATMWVLIREYLRRQRRANPADYDRLASVVPGTGGLARWLLGSD